MREPVLTRSRVILLLTLAAVALAIAAKLLLTSGPLLPGLDGAYYWVQVKALLTRGALAYSDLPAVFWAQAGLAKLLGDIPLAVRLTDAVLPVLAAIPLFLLARHDKSGFAAPLVVLAVLLHPIQLYFFTGDFIKNEAALPLVFLLGWLLATWKPERRTLRLLALSATLLLAALSHFGVLLLALAMTAVWLVARLGRRSPRFWLFAVGSLFVAGAVVAGLLWLLVRARFDRLLALVANPAGLFTEPLGAFLFTPSLRPTLQFAVLSGQLGAVVLAVLAWRARAQLSPATKAALGAFLVTAFAFSSPVVGREWAERLTALSFAPLALAAILLAVQNLRAARTVGLALAGFTLVASAVLAPLGATPPTFDEQEWAAFQDLTAKVSLERPSLVIARHGVDFLVAWSLATDVVQDRSATPESGAAYRAVYVLLEGASRGQVQGGLPLSDVKGKEPLGDKGPPGGKGPPAPPTYPAPTLVPVYSNDIFTFAHIEGPETR